MVGEAGLRWLWLTSVMDGCVSLMMDGPAAETVGYDVDVDVDATGVVE